MLAGVRSCPPCSRLILGLDRSPGRRRTGRGPFFPKTSDLVIRDNGIVAARPTGQGGPRRRPRTRPAPAGSRKREDCRATVTGASLLVRLF